MNWLTNYLERQKEWSQRTFGADGRRTIGILKHIRKELLEIEAKPDDLEEWIDVAILAMEGYWRHGGTPEEFPVGLTAKQLKNFLRQWGPPGPEDEPMEHVREIP